MNRRVDRTGGQRAEQDAGGQAGGQGAAGQADAPRRHVFGDEHPGARHFAAIMAALHHAQGQQRQRRPDADLRIGRQQAHEQGRHRHQEDAQGEHALALEQVAEVRQDDAAQRPRQVAGGEDAEGLQLAQPFRHVGREEQLAQHGGEEHEDDEVVELQRTAQGGSERVCGRCGSADATGAVGHARRTWESFIIGNGKDCAAPYKTASAPRSFGGKRNLRSF